MATKLEALVTQYEQVSGQNAQALRTAITLLKAAATAYNEHHNVLESYRKQRRQMAMRNDAQRYEGEAVEKDNEAHRSTRPTAAETEVFAEAKTAWQDAMVAVQGCVADLFKEATDESYDSTKMALNALRDHCFSYKWRREFLNGVAQLRAPKRFTIVQSDDNNIIRPNFGQSRHTATA